MNAIEGFQGCTLREVMCVLWQRTRSRKRRRHLARQISRRRLKEFYSERDRYEYSNWRFYTDEVTGFPVRSADCLDKKTGEMHVSMQIDTHMGCCSGEGIGRLICRA